MLKGIKFNQQKPEIQQAELDLLLLNPDTKYIPQSNLLEYKKINIIKLKRNGKKKFLRKFMSSQ